MFSVFLNQRFTAKTGEWEAEVLCRASNHITTVGMQDGGAIICFMGFLPSPHYHSWCKD